MPEDYKPPEIIEVQGIGYSLVFDDLHCSKDIFSKFDLLPTGHNWEKAIELFCDENNIDISMIQFDSESDLFSAHSDNKESLNKIIVVIDGFLKNEKNLSNLLKEIDDNLWCSAEETFEELEDDGVDFTKAIEFDFMVDFNDRTKLKKACNITSRIGYKCFYTNQFEMASIKKIIPNKANIQECSAHFKKLAVDLDGKLSVYGVMDIDDEPYEELEHWSLYVFKETT